MHGWLYRRRLESVGLGEGKFGTGFQLLWENGAFDRRPMLARQHVRLARAQAVTRPTFGRAAGIVKMAAESPNRPAGGQCVERSLCLRRWSDAV